MALNSKTPSYLQPTASTAQRAASAAAPKRTRPPSKHVPPPPQSRPPLAPAAHATEPQPSPGDEPSSKGESKPPVTESRVTEAPIAQPSHSLQARSSPVPPESSHDTLQVAAQVQSWLFMRSDLQTSLSLVQKSAQDSYDVLAEAISNDASPGSGTSRSDAEELVTFLDDVSNAGSDARLALFVHRYLEHEKSWLKLQSGLTQFVARLSQAPTDSPREEGENLKARLSEEASRIETLLTEAESWKNEPGRIHRTLAQLYPILRARSDNASIASDAIDCSLDNIRAMHCLRP
ncbi:hypothetical protein BC827DRAFT_1264930 [Russula dissimulans]|nr:hypothetical protein BC827DRAFT_1264930 [Russula dissimulans]